MLIKITKTMMNLTQDFHQIPRGRPHLSPRRRPRSSNSKTASKSFQKPKSRPKKRKSFLLQASGVVKLSALSSPKKRMTISSR